MGSSQEPLVDALPYIDGGFDDNLVREMVFAMINEETKRYKPTKNYLEHLPEARLHEFETDLMAAEMQRLASRQPMDQLSMKRYELPGPGKHADIAAWTEAVNNSMAQLEHQAVRIANLTVMSRYGQEAWKTYNTVLANELEGAQKRLAALKKAVQEINWQRKSDQQNAGEKLKNLEQKWVGLISKNFDIEQACDSLEADLAALEQRLGASEQAATGNDENEPPQSNQ